MIQGKSVSTKLPFVKYIKDTLLHTAYTSNFSKQMNCVSIGTQKTIKRFKKKCTSEKIPTDIEGGPFVSNTHCPRYFTRITYADILYI